MVFDDIRKTLEAVIGQLSPAKAQAIAKRYLEPEAAKEQVTKTASELVQLSQRLRDSVRKEVVSQMRSMGVATQGELDSLRKRVRELERSAGRTASGRKKTTSSVSRAASRKKTGASRKSAARR